MKKLLLFLILLLSLGKVHAQNVGIGTSTPATKLHVAGTSSTLRLEGISSTLGGTNIVAATASTDKIVYVNSNGDFNALPSGVAGQVLTLNGSAIPTWTSASTTGWLLTGNMLSGTESIGSLNPFDFIVKTNTFERMRVASGGNIGINVAPAGTERLFISDAAQVTTLHSLNSNAAAGSSAVRANGITGTDAYLSYFGSITLNTTTVTNAGIYSVVTSGTSGAIIGSTTGGSGSAIYGYSTVANAGRFTNTIASTQALFAANLAASGAGAGSGVTGTTAQSNGMGVVATNSNAGGVGLLAIGNNVPGFIPGASAGAGGAFNGSLFGAWSLAQGSAGIGVWSLAQGSAGIGVMGIGNNVIGFFPGGSQGAGGVFDGSLFGVWSLAQAAAGIGMLGLGNNLGGYTYPVSGSGGTFNGNTLGSYNYCTTNANGNGAGYFQSGPGVTNFAWIAYKFGGTDYAINGTGLKATIVKDLDNQNVNMVCPEAPEALFEDYGEGQLVNGTAHIDLDPIFAKNVAIRENHPLRVFIQLEGNCNGVYVTNKTGSGFDVVELSGGNSNVAFSWHVIANRVDTKDGNGNILSYNQDNRWQKSGPSLQTQTQTLQKSEAQVTPR